MYFRALSLSWVLYGVILVASQLVPFSAFSDVTIFVPPPNYTEPRVLYARSLELEGGVLLATWENYSPEPPLVYFPIFQSVDGGETWKEISRVTDEVNQWGLRYQPFLYEMPVGVGKYPAGTILCAGNSIPTNLNSTQIDIYASEDKGYTWKFVSKVASGGAATPSNGVPAIWEPFIMWYEGQIVIFYSDQRDSAHGQKLVHQTSKDLLTWEAPVDDVAYPKYTDRPGMTSVTQLPNGKYMMTYEYGGGKWSGNKYSYPVYYRISENPLLFTKSVGYQLVSSDRKEPVSSPYITWSPFGGPNGTIIVSSYSHSQIFTNQALGDVKSWKTVSTPSGTSYSRQLRALNSSDYLLIIGAGALNPSTPNKVAVCVIDLQKSLGSAASQRG